MVTAMDTVTDTLIGTDMVTVIGMDIGMAMAAGTVGAGGVTASAHVGA